MNIKRIKSIVLTVLVLVILNTGAKVIYAQNVSIDDHITNTINVIDPDSEK